MSSSTGDSESRDSQLGRRVRVLVAGAGALSWSAGAAATFVADNGAGAAALVAAGAIAGGIAAVGRWPSRVSVSGNTVEWSEVRETLESQITFARLSGQPADTIAELIVLKERLDSLADTGHVKPHPAEEYDLEVISALRRVAPRARLERSAVKSRDVPDFTLREGDRVVHVETKWRSNSTTPFVGSTLRRVLDPLPDGARLLVAVNSRDVTRAELQARHYDRLRVRVLPWLDPSDDSYLADALCDLFAV